jgi:hypothetical protein
VEEEGTAEDEVDDPMPSIHSNEHGFLGLGTDLTHGLRSGATFVMAMNLAAWLLAFHRHTKRPDFFGLPFYIYCSCINNSIPRVRVASRLTARLPACSTYRPPGTKLPSYHNPTTPTQRESSETPPCDNPLCLIKPLAS